MANLSAAMPTYATPFLTADGRINEPWYRFLFQLQLRGGGSAGTDFATQAELDALTAVVNDQDREINGLYPVPPLLQDNSAFWSMVPLSPIVPQDSDGMVPILPNTLGLQSADSVAITGGAIDGTTIGATTPSSGAFSTLSTSGAVSGAGFVSRFSSPGPIGNTTPSSGAFTTVSATGTITPDQLNGIVGTTTNNNANAGSVGEFVSNTTTGTPVANGVTFNATSVSLTAGDWDVQTTISFNIVVAATFLNNNQVGVSTTSATMPTTLGQRALYTFHHDGTVTFIVPSPVVRLSLPATTTVYGVGFTAFSAGTLTADGFIRARRVR